MAKKASFIPALKFNWLTRFYDPLMNLIASEKKFKKAFLLQATIKDHDIILDFGCGTGTLTIMAKEEAPKALVHGVEIDPNILEIARSKVKNSGYEIFFKTYNGIALPYKDKSFDKILSSIVFHHLTRRQKIIALEEIYRVLKTDGELYIADFGKARNIWMRGIFLPVQLFDGFANTSDNIKGLLPEIMKEAGFNQVTEHKQIKTLLGPISFYEATKNL